MIEACFHITRKRLGTVSNRIKIAGILFSTFNNLTQGNTKVFIKLGDSTRNRCSGGITNNWFKIKPTRNRLSAGRAFIWRIATAI